MTVPFHSFAFFLTGKKTLECIDTYRADLGPPKTQQWVQQA